MDSSTNVSNSISIENECPNKKENLENNPNSIKKSQCPFSIFKSFVKQFLQLYSMRALLTFIPKLFKIKFNLFKLTINEIIQILFNTNNLKTGLSLSLMPFIFRILNFIFDHSEGLKKINFDKRLLTFISGFVAGLVGICLAEKANIMKFIIISVSIRSIHNLISVYLKKKGLSTHNRLVGYLILNLACSGVLFLNYYHPSFTAISKLVDRYSLYSGTEKMELDSIKEVLRLDKNI